MNLGILKVLCFEFAAVAFDMAIIVATKTFVASLCALLGSSVQWNVDCAFRILISVGMGFGSKRDFGVEGKHLLNCGF